MPAGLLVLWPNSNALSALAELITCQGVEKEEKEKEETSLPNQWDQQN